MLRVLGAPYMKQIGFRDLSRCHHRKLCFIRKNIGGADRFGPTQNSRIFKIDLSVLDLIGFAYALKVMDSHTF